MPLSLLLLGLYLNFSFEKKYIRPIAKFLVFRYGLGLFVGLTLYFFLPVNEMFKNTLLLGLFFPLDWQSFRMRLSSNIKQRY